MNCRVTHPSRRRPNTRQGLVLVGVLGVALAGGCASRPSSPQPIDPSPRLSMQAEAERAIADSVAAVRRGDLKTAENKALVAQNLAQSPRQERQAESVLLLVEGTHAMLNGQPDLAGIAWAAIPDPGLRKEVMASADRLGIHVPVASADPQPVASINKDL